MVGLLTLMKIYWIIVIYVCVGTTSYKQSLNLNVWAHCYLQHAYNAPPFYTEEFNAATDAILAELHTSQQEITVSTARTIYLHLCSKFNI